MGHTFQTSRRKALAQEEAWRREREHSTTEARARFREISDRVAVPEGAMPALLDAAMEAARFYAMECAYANYELRTGCAFPPERREAEEHQEQVEWRACLARLEAALAGEVRRATPVRR
jgi:hypothetical protein